MFKHTKLCTSMVLAFGALAIAPGGASAQEVKTLQRVEVTGSNIPRTDKETASPIQVITNEDLKASGFTTVNEVLQNLTANGAGTLSKGFSGAFAGGASGISLRGLTLGATLVLIDGHRMAPYPLGDDAQRQFVDISSIPFSTVERIEILKDGASSIYGSDAIAGVVNVILKRSFKGTSISAEIGDTALGGGASRNFSIAHGFGDIESGNHGYLSLEVRKSDAIKTNQRDQEWTRTDWTAEGGENLKPGSVNNFARSPTTRTPLLQLPGSSNTSAANFVFLDSNCDYTKWRASACAYENNWSTLQPATENVNLLGRWNTKLSPNWDLRLTGSRFESKTEIVNGPLTVPTGSFAGVTATGPGIIPSIIGAIPVFRVPANYPGNTFGVPANVRALIPDLGQRTNQTDAIATRFVAELSGVAAGWDVNASVGSTQVEAKQTTNGLRNNAALYAALNDPVNPFKLTGGNSAAVMALVSPTIENTSTSKLTFIEGRGSRALFDLAGGPLSVGVGFSVTNKDLNQPNPKESQNGSVSGAGSAYAIGTERDNALFAELVAPVTKELELSASARYDNYDTYGNSFTPKLAFKYAPSKAFAIRGTATAGFRAPSAAEVGNAGSQFVFTALRDPLLCPTSLPSGNPDLTAATNVPAFCSFTPVYLQSTTPTLEPEKSKSLTFGLIFEPVQNWSTTLDFYKITIDGQIVPESAVPGLYQPLNHLVRGIPSNVTYGDGSSGTSSVGPVQYVTTGYINGQTSSTTGVELETRYKFKLADRSSLTVGVQLSHVFSYTQTIGGATYELAGTHGPSIVGGDTGNPRDRAQLTLTYESGPLTLATTTNYVGTYDHTDPSLGYNDCAGGITGNSTAFAFNAPISPSYCQVDSFMYTNVVAKYQVSKSLTVRGSVVNLFNKTAPTDVSTYGGTGQTLYNPSLHQAGAIGRAYSVGLDYNF